MDVVLVRAGALGDVLLLRRAVAGLRAAGHRPRLVAPAGPGASLVGPGPSEVEALLPWDGPEAAALLAGEAVDGPLLQAVGGADIVVAYTRSPDTVRALRRAAAGRVIVHDPAPPAGVHAATWLGAPLSALGAAPSCEPPPLEFTRAEREEAARRTEQLPPGYLAFHPGSGSPAKNWPAERFVELAVRLTEGRPFLFCSGPAERERGLAVELPQTAVVARDWPIRVLGAALARAGLYVGNDSGASHLAAAAGAPTLALFGPTDPAAWAPTGRGVCALRAADARMASLSVDEALRAGRSLREGRTAPG